jgi:hypothetical protein
MLLAVISPEPKDVMVAIFGASAGAAGLVLVFLAILIAAVASYPGETSRATLNPLRRSAWAAFAIFGVSLLTTTLSLLWLAVSDGRALYLATIFMFFGLLIGLSVIAAAVVKATV